MVGRQHRYAISAIYKTLQGEGHFVGYPCVLVRLAGCSVTECSIRKECDEAPWKAKETLLAWEIALRARDLLPGGIALITGGEPTDHNLMPLIDCLRSEGLRVHLETSGVRSVDGYPFDWITVSPKTPDYVQRQGHTLKVLVRPYMDWRGIDELDRGTTFFHRYLQPITWPQRPGAKPETVPVTTLRLALDLIQSRENVAGRWALSTQAHKAWGLP